MSTHDAGDESQLRVGVVGGGFIGTTVGGEFNDLQDATVVALADVSDEAREEAGEQLAVSPAKQYKSYESMLDGESLDAILIGTPHTLHYEQVTAALDRGLHVLCDKPLTTDLDRARDLRDRARNGDEVLMVGYQRHLNPAFIDARERWADSDLTPEWISAEVSQDWIDRFEETWRRNPELSGGGYLYDTGSHLLDAILWTTGLTPTAVSARMTYVDDEQRVDNWADLTIEFEEGARASVTTYGETPAVREHIHIWDEEGAIYLTGREWEPRQLAEVDVESTDHVPFIDPRDRQSKAAAFVEAIREGTQPAATAQDGLRVTAVTEAAYESAARDGAWVDLDPKDTVID